MFGKLRLIGRGARTAEGTAQAAHTAAPEPSQAATLEKVITPKALAARLLASPMAWRNALPRLESPATGDATDAPRSATREP